jgi:hypothetical protein
MINTPETDAAIKESSKWKMPLISAGINGVTWDGPTVALCRKLERERDAAKAPSSMWPSVPHHLPRTAGATDAREAESASGVTAGRG